LPSAILEPSARPRDFHVWPGRGNASPTEPGNMGKGTRFRSDLTTINRVVRGELTTRTLSGRARPFRSRSARRHVG
jgi:hypothetical protein